MTDQLPSSDLARLHATVEGRVQGVGFRAFVEDSAFSLNLTGWVRNRWSGSVEVMAEGPRLQLEKLLLALQRGPRAAHVIKVDSQWEKWTGEFGDFRLRSTAS